VNFDVGPSRGIDAATVLTVYICVLLAIPARMVVGPLGSAGSPSTIMAIGVFFLWVWFHVARSKHAVERPQPVRAAAVSWLLVMLIVYAHAMSSPMPADEISPADHGMLRLVGLTGILLVVNDGTASLERIRAVLRRLVIGVGLIAVLGIVQYATNQLLVDRINIPGLTTRVSDDFVLFQRNGLARPPATSTHPIEYGVVLTMALPIAITFALRSPTRRWTYKAFVGVISFAALLTLSRSAVICAGVGLIVLAMSWTAAARLRAFVAVLGVAVLAYLTVPGVLGTITRLFTGAFDDASIASRTGSYDLAGSFIGKSPLLGRGFSTFLPKYWILDNGYLGFLIEGGILGLGGLLVLFVVAALAAGQARRMARGDFDRALAQALRASIVAGACSLAFFDTFAYPQSSGCLFLLLGLAGALRRLTIEQARTDQLVQLGPTRDYRTVSCGDRGDVQSPATPR
jgi:polysaccharide biosynthesis protein PslJ